jgi:hypothetical protein
MTRAKTRFRGRLQAASYSFLVASACAPALRWLLELATGTAVGTGYWNWLLELLFCSSALLLFCSSKPIAPHSPSSDNGRL